MKARIALFLVLAALIAASSALGATVKVYFVKDGQFGALERQVPEGADPQKFAFEALAAGPTAEEFAAGWRSLLPLDSKLVDYVGGRSRITVDYGGEGLKAPMANGDRDYMIGQIGRTAEQFEGIRGMKIRRNGDGLRSMHRPIFSQIPIQVQPLPWQAKSLGHLKQVHKDGTVSYTVLGALLGKRIAISPGHGWTYAGKDESGKDKWRLQRGYWWGIVEDFLNPEIIMYLNKYLTEAGARVIPVRELDKNAGNGVSGYPKWQEAGKYYAQAQGAPKWVYQVFENDEEGSDIVSRGFYPAWRGADIQVSLHNNGSKGSGTLTLYETSNGFQDESKKLAEAIHNRVMGTVRKEFVPNWHSYGVQGFAGSYGENNWCQHPATLLEIAFMDTQEPDNRLLHDEKFKESIGRAIYEGICDYFDRDPTYKVSD